MTLFRMASAKRFSMGLIVALWAAVALAEMADRGEAPRRIDRAVARHYVIQAQHTLRDFERNELAAAGCEVQQELGSGRYIVRIRPDAELQENDPLFRTIERLTAERKIAASAFRAAGPGRAFARLNIIFNKDVSLSDAQSLVEQLGGAVDNPLLLGFQLPRRLSARIPAAALQTLAGDERVYAIYGPALHTRSDNAEEALQENVVPLYGAPYGLTGNGVVASVYDKGAVDASHKEFGGRVTVHTTQAIDSHPTHVTGTIAASGPTASCATCLGEAKGMATGVRVHEFDVDDDPGVLGSKQKNYPLYSVATDNNSWGYILGWNNSSTNGWTWTGNEEYFGAYEYTNMALDHITRATGTLMVHSSGNDAASAGPSSSPFRHYHTDPNTGDTTTTVTWCVVPNATGNICPASVTGCDQCEATNHPANGPWTSIGLTGSAKNVIAVGAVNLSKTIASFSSRGPTRDGRIKPEVVAKGSSVFSTYPSNSYGVLNGTSMSCPVVTGISALLIEQWRKTFAGANPSPVMIKTLLIEGAEDLLVSPVDGSASLKGPDYVYGFGLVNAKASVDLIRNDGGSGSLIRTGSAAQGATVEFPFTVSATTDIRVTLGWSDPEVALLPDDPPLQTRTLLNDLDLSIVDPAGAQVLPYVLDPTHPSSPATRGANHVDNTEQVEIFGAKPGAYKIVVRGTSVEASFSPQQFVILSNTPLAAPIVPCSDIYEPNDTAASAFGNIGSGQAISARTCTATDLDYFKFQVDRSGPVVVRLTATDTPVRLTVTGGGNSASADLAIGATGSVALQAGSGSGTAIAPTQYLVKVEPTGAIGSNAGYNLTATFSSSGSRKRGANH